MIEVRKSGVFQAIPITAHYGIVMSIWNGDDFIYG